MVVDVGIFLSPACLRQLLHVALVSVVEWLFTLSASVAEGTISMVAPFFLPLKFSVVSTPFRWLYSFRNLPRALVRYTCNSYPSIYLVYLSVFKFGGIPWE